MIKRYDNWSEEEKAILIVAFCKSRLKSLCTLSRNGQARYTEKECEIAEKIRLVVACDGHPSDTRNTGVYV